MECRSLEKGFIFEQKSVFGARSATLSYQGKLWVEDHNGSSSTKVLSIPKRKCFGVISTSKLFDHFTLLQG